MPPLDLILARGAEWLAVVLALTGIGLGSWFAVDSWRDLAAYRLQGWNGFAELTAWSEIRSGACLAGMHLFLAVLPALSLLSQTPPKRWLVAAIFFGSLNLAQLTVIVGQLLNQRARIRTKRLAMDQPPEK